MNSSVVPAMYASYISLLIYIYLVPHVPYVCHSIK